MKRAIDIVVSAVLLFVLSPVIAALAATVRATTRGPALHRARRVGRAGAEFTMYKLRTMRVDASGPRITSRDDRRVTPFGRFLRRMRLDELPQLWNVLRGDMSLVGPRPEDPRFVERYTAEQLEILSVRPGLTGPAQLAHRDEEKRLPAGDTEETYARDILPGKLAIDLDYARHRSLLGDIAILLRTVGAALRR